jgi:hypothetical protein
MTELLEIVQNFNENKATKRVEENRKLVISMVVKHLKDSCSEKLDKMKDKHRKFYKKYFMEVFSKEGISYEVLFEKNRKVNKSYISTLMKSSLFEKDFREFLMGGFRKKYEEMRQKKVGKIVEKCQNLMKNRKQGC